MSALPRGVPVISLALVALAVVLFALALLALRASPRAGANRSLAVGALAAAVWILGVSGLQTGADLHFWLAVAFAGASFIPAALLQLVRHYPVTTRSPSLATLAASYALAAVFAGCAGATPLVFSRPRLVEGVLVRDTGPLYPVFCAYFLVAWLAAGAVLARKWRLATPRQRVQLGYFGSGVMLSGAGGVTTNLLIPSMTGNSAYNWLGPYFVIPFIVFAAHSIVRHRLMDLRLVLHRKLLAALASVLSLTPLAAVAALLLADGAGALDGRALILLALAGLAVPLARDAVSGLLDRYFYRARANYRETVRASSALLTRGQTIRSLMDAMARHVLDATHPEGVAIYLGRSRSVSRTAAQATEAIRFEAPDVLPALVADSLPGSGGGLWAAHPLGARPTARSGAVTAVLAELNWAGILPLRSDDAVIGAIALGPKLSGDPYYPQDRDLLATLANQAGLGVKNAQLYAEVALANEHVENIVATINSGVVAIDAGARITLFNRAAEQLTGLLASDVRRQPTSVLPPCLGMPLVQAAAGGEAVTYPEIALPRGGSARPVICTVSPLRDAAGGNLGSVAVFSDLTPLRELEEERRRGEKLDYFKTLASGLAHEIQNPLVSIKTFVQLVPQRRDDARWLDGFSHIAHREIERLERLLQRLASLGRPTERPQTPLDLRLPVREALELVEPDFAERRIRIEARLGEREQRVLGDGDELKQLVHNLLINALHHTPVDGTLTVELKEAEGRAVLSVSDTGSGIPPELLERIFDPFFTMRPRGTGLGLAICTGIATAHRARLHAANRPSGGATFTVEFPLVAPTGPLASGPSARALRG